MREVSRNNAIPTQSVVRAGLLLVGLLGVAYGYFNDQRTYLYAGVILIIGNVLLGVVDLVNRR
jgi:hypothetical protein